jgi:site-specific recombinase XerD
VVKALLHACPASPVGARNRALITILYRAGLRVSEALALCVDDLRLDLPAITVREGKGGRSRIVGIDKDACGSIEQWLRKPESLRLAAEAPLFCTMSGARVQPSYVRALLPRLASAASVSKRVHAHGLRHTHAAELALEGFPLNLIQAQLGHASLATTDRYLRHIAPAQLISAIGEREWPPP